MWAGSNFSYYLIGLFVVVGTLLAAGMAVLVGSGVMTGDQVAAETLMEESITGLDQGSAVRFRGVRVGEVTDIGIASSLYATEANYVVVRFTIAPISTEKGESERARASLRRLVQRGLRVRVASSGLTGQAYLEADILEDAASRFPPLPRDWPEAGPEERVYIPAAASTLSSLVDSVSAVLKDVHRADLPRLMEETRGTLEAIRDAVEAARLGELSEELSGLMGQGKAVLTHMDRDASKLTAGVRSAAESVGAAADRARKLLEDPRVESLIGDLERAAAGARRLLTGPDLHRTVEGLEAATNEARMTLEAARETLETTDKVLGRVEGAVTRREPALSAVTDNLVQITRHLRQLSRTLQHYPSYGILGAPPPRHAEPRRP